MFALLFIIGLFVFLGPMPALAVIGVLAIIDAL